MAARHRAMRKRAKKLRQRLAAAAAPVVWRRDVAADAETRRRGERGARGDETASRDSNARKNDAVLERDDDDASLSLDDDMFLRRRGTRACLQLAHKWESTALAAAVCELCRCPVLRVLVSSHPLCSSRDKLCPCVLFAFGRHSSRSSVQFCVAEIA